MKQRWRFAFFLYTNPEPFSPGCVCPAVAVCLATFEAYDRHSTCSTNTTVFCATGLKREFSSCHFGYFRSFPATVHSLLVQSLDWPEIRWALRKRKKKRERGIILRNRKWLWKWRNGESYETRLQIYFLTCNFISIKEIVCWNVRGDEFLIAVMFGKRNLLRVIIILWYLREEKEEKWRKSLITEAETWRSFL